jgi:hypothetical protein
MQLKNSPWHMWATCREGLPTKAQNQSWGADRGQVFFHSCCLRKRCYRSGSCRFDGWESQRFVLSSAGRVVEPRESGKPAFGFPLSLGPSELLECGIATRFPRAVGRVENLVLVFHAFHGPPFQQLFSWFLDERGRQRFLGGLPTGVVQSQFASASAMIAGTRLFAPPLPPPRSSRRRCRSREGCVASLPQHDTSSESES